MNILITQSQNDMWTQWVYVIAILRTRHYWTLMFLLGLGLCLSFKGLHSQPLLQNGTTAVDRPHVTAPWKATSEDPWEWCALWCWGLQSSPFLEIPLSSPHHQFAQHSFLFHDAESDFFGGRGNNVDTTVGRSSSLPSGAPWSIWLACTWCWAHHKLMLGWHLCRMLQSWLMPCLCHLTWQALELDCWWSFATDISCYFWMSFIKNQRLI